MTEATTVRLNDEERALLDELASEFGGWSGAIKQGIAMLAQEHRRRRALDRFKDDWVAETGPAGVVRLVQRRGRQHCGRRPRRSGCRCRWACVPPAQFVVPPMSRTASLLAAVNCSELLNRCPSYQSTRHCYLPNVR